MKSCVVLVQEKHSVPVSRASSVDWLSFCMRLATAAIC